MGRRNALGRNTDAGAVNISAILPAGHSEAGDAGSAGAGGAGGAEHAGIACGAGAGKTSLAGTDIALGAVTDDRFAAGSPQA